MDWKYGGKLWEFQGVLKVLLIFVQDISTEMYHWRLCFLSRLGLFAFIVTLAVYGTMFKLDKFPMDYIAANYLSLATGSFIFSFILGLAVFIQTRYFAEDAGSSGKYPSHV